MAPSFEIVDDTIIPHGGSYENLTPRENNVRNAMFFVTLLAPIFGSVIVWLYANKGCSYKSIWSIHRLTIIWFLSVGLFGSLVYLQRGSTNRTTFMFAILHTQTEILFNAYLLKVDLRKALALSALWGLVLYTATLAFSTMTGVFFASAILGGANDLLIFLLLAYGKKYLYAAGAFFHVLSAIILFANSVIFFDVVLYTVLVFLSLWLYLGFTTAAILRDTRVKSYIALPDPTHSTHSDSGLNPLAEVTVPTPVLLVMIGVSLIESAFVTVLLYVFA